MACELISIEFEIHTKLKCPNCHGKLRIINLNRSYYAIVGIGSTQRVFGYEDLTSQKFHRFFDNKCDYLWICEECTYAVSQALMKTKR